MKTYIVTTFDYETEREETFRVRGASLNHILEKLAQKYVDEDDMRGWEKFYSLGQWFRYQMDGLFFPMWVEIKEVMSDGSLSADLLRQERGMPK